MQHAAKSFIARMVSISVIFSWPAHCESSLVQNSGSNISRVWDFTAEHFCFKEAEKHGHITVYKTENNKNSLQNKSAHALFNSNK